LNIYDLKVLKDKSKSYYKNCEKELFENIEDSVIYEYVLWMC